MSWLCDQIAQSFFKKCLFSNLEPSLCFCTYLPAPGVQHFSEAASVDHWYSLLYNMCRGVCILIMEIVTVMPQVNVGFSVIVTLYLLFQALPQIFINRLGLRSSAVQTFFRSILPIPLSGKFCVLNTSRCAYCINSIVESHTVEIIPMQTLYLKFSFCILGFY